MYDLFVTLEAVTPNEYKLQGRGLVINFGFHHTPFGECLIALTHKGICSLSFVDSSSKEEELTLLQKKWAQAEIREEHPQTFQTIQQIFFHTKPAKIHLLVKGTNFQIKVWEALLKIPSGSVTTYQHIAEAIYHPKAFRAVGSAVGKNPVGFLIPCHRVIQKSGQIGAYHWGQDRKKAIIGYEMAHQ